MAQQVLIDSETLETLRNMSVAAMMYSRAAVVLVSPVNEAALTAAIEAADEVLAAAERDEWAAAAAAGVDVHFVRQVAIAAITASRWREAAAEAMDADEDWLVEEVLPLAVGLPGNHDANTVDVLEVARITLVERPALASAQVGHVYTYGQEQGQRLNQFLNS